MNERPTSRFSYDRSAFLYVAITLLLGIGSLHSQNNLLFLAFGVAVGVMLVNGTYAWASMRSLRLWRHAPARGEVGRELTIRYHVQTRSRFVPAAAVLITERAAPTGCRASAACVTRSAPARASARLVPEKRGELRLLEIDASSRFPFGAAKKTVRFKRRGAILVRPRPIYPDEQALVAATTGRSSASASLRRAGVGDEVFGLREYALGDPIRRIAWRASARHGDWLVREHAANTSAAVRLGLRLAPDGPDEINEEAISLAAGALAMLQRRGQRAALCDPARDGALIENHPAALDALARLDLARVRGGTPALATLIVEATPGGARVYAVTQRAGARAEAGARA